MVHEEEEGVSMSLFMLLGQAAHAAAAVQDEPLPDLPPPPPLTARQVDPGTLHAAAACNLFTHPDLVTSTLDTKGMGYGIMHIVDPAHLPVYCSFYPEHPHVWSQLQLETSCQMQLFLYAGDLSCSFCNLQNICLWGGFRSIVFGLCIVLIKRCKL